VIIGLDTLNEFDSIGYHEQPDIRRDVFLNTGAACDLLVDAFSKLPNLRSVGLRDYDGNGRLRDGERAKWRSYGWSLGGTRERFRQHYAPPDSMLPILLFALGKASVRPTNLEAFLRKRKMPDRSFDLGCLQIDVAPVLSGLRTLLLSLDDARTANPQQGSKSTGHGHLKDFLQHTPLLEHLRLNFTGHVAITSEDVGSEGFLRWLGTPIGVASKSGPTPIALDHLTTLDLGMLYVTPKTLLRVVSKCAKLKALSLWKVNLQCFEDRSDNADCLWASCLPQIGKAFQAPEDVGTIMIGFAAEATRFHLEDVKFASKVSVDGNGEKKFEDPEGKASYRKRVGTNAKDWLEDLSKKTFIDKPDVIDYSGDSEDDEDDEGEDTQGDDDGEDAEDDEGESDGDGGGEAQVIVLD
jgi:hypothetical protein